MMKRALVLIVMALMLDCIGCNSVEAQRRRFVQSHDAQVGLRFYAYEKRSMREVKLSDTESDFVPDPTPECGVVWRVDTTSRGPYHHPNGMTFDVEGVKKSWRFVGDPAKCLMRINWMNW